MTDYMFVGLGNPGLKYAESRHNLGAACITKLAHQHETKLRSSSLALYGNIQIGEAEILIVRPRTWYNGTGQAVQFLLERNQMPIDRLIVIYDEVELPDGRVDLQPCTGDSGNNGLRSIIDTIASRDFQLIRIGAGGNHGMRRTLFDPNMILRHVLALPRPEARVLLDSAVEHACTAVSAIATSGWAKVFAEWEPVNADSSQA